MSGMYALPLCVPINRAYKGVAFGLVTCVMCACKVCLFGYLLSYINSHQQVGRSNSVSSNMFEKFLKCSENDSITSGRGFICWGRKCNPIESSWTAAKWIFVLLFCWKRWIWRFFLGQGTVSSPPKRQKSNFHFRELHFWTEIVVLSYIFLGSDVQIFSASVTKSNDRKGSSDPT